MEGDERIGLVCLRRRVGGGRLWEARPGQPTHNHGADCGTRLAGRGQPRGRKRRVVASSRFVTRSSRGIPSLFSLDPARAAALYSKCCAVLAIWRPSRTRLTQAPTLERGSDVTRSFTARISPARRQTLGCNAKSGHSPVTIAAYTRCSTVDQAMSGLGLAAQRAAIAQYCSTHFPGQPVTWVTEHASGKDTDERPLLRETLDSNGTLKALVVLRLDRLARNTLDLLRIIDALKTQGAALHSVHEHIQTDSPAANFYLTVLAAAAQLERDLISQRTREALAQKRARGEHVGRPPLGFLANPFRVDPETIHIPLAIFALRRRGYSHTRIARKLDLPVSTVRSVLANDIYRRRSLI